MEPWHLYLTILLGFAFMTGWAVRDLWCELTPVIVFWYNMRKKPTNYGEPVKPTEVQSLKDYEDLTLRKRFTMERDKRLN